VYREVAIVFVAAGPTRGPLSGLSYRAVKVARGVLRGGSGGNATSLPDPLTASQDLICLNVSMGS
jgi:hypothetical protein